MSINRDMNSGFGGKFRGRIIMSAKDLKGPIKSQNISKSGNKFLNIFNFDLSKFKNINLTRKNQLENVYDHSLDYFKKNPNKYLELVNNTKNKVSGMIYNINQKLIDIKKNISKVNNNFKQAMRKIGLFKDRKDKLERELNKIRNQIKELSKQPGKEKEIEQLKLREQDIINRLRQFDVQINIEKRNLEQYKAQKQKLLEQKNKIELQKNKYQNKSNDLDKQKSALEKNLGYNKVLDKKEETLERFRHWIIDNRRSRELTPTQISVYDLNFKATFNLETNNIDYGKDRRGIPTFAKNIPNPHFKKPSWLETRKSNAIAKAKNYNAIAHRRGYEHGGKDNPSR